jgi:hypothetical protein
MQDLQFLPAVVVGDYRSQFPAVDNLGCPGGGVSDQPGDLFDADAAVVH